jgi:hypothetical protein
MLELQTRPQLARTAAKTLTRSLGLKAKPGRLANQTTTGAVIFSAALAAGAIYLATRPSKKLYFRPVRDAGPDAMENPPSDWDRTDQAMDESFPCSDPPAHCIRSRYR